MNPGPKFVGLHAVRIARTGDFGRLLPDLRVVRLNKGRGFEKSRQVAGSAVGAGGRINGRFAPDRDHTVPIDLTAAVKKKGVLLKTLQADLQDFQRRGALYGFRRGMSDFGQIRADRANPPALSSRDPLQRNPQDALSRAPIRPGRPGVCFIP
jgi:hypothetical protein